MIKAMETTTAAETVAIDMTTTLAAMMSKTMVVIRSGNGAQNRGREGNPLVLIVLVQF